jgi:hypothetical protein
MAWGVLLKRLERAEEAAKALSPLQLTPFDQDALAIYSAMAYLDATMLPTYDEVEPTAVYMRGRELRNALYGPVIPANLNAHLKRYTRVSGEFELAFGREPKAGDVLRYEDVARMHSSENLLARVWAHCRGLAAPIASAYVSPEVRGWTLVQAPEPKKAWRDASVGRRRQNPARGALAINTRGSIEYGL